VIQYLLWGSNPSIEKKTQNKILLRNENICPHKKLYTSVYIAVLFIRDQNKNQLSIDRQTDG
jgi:hypothetical protein